jgi:hypothetical protein
MQSPEIRAINSSFSDKELESDISQEPRDVRPAPIWPLIAGDKFLLTLGGRKTWGQEIDIYIYSVLFLNIFPISQSFLKEHVCVHYVHAISHACHHACMGQKAIQDAGFELRLLGLATSIPTHWALWPALDMVLKTVLTPHLSSFQNYHFTFIETIKKKWIFNSSSKLKSVLWEWFLGSVSCPRWPGYKFLNLTLSVFLVVKWRWSCLCPAIQVVMKDLCQVFHLLTERRIMCLCVCYSCVVVIVWVHICMCERGGQRPMSDISSSLSSLLLFFLVFPVRLIFYDRILHRTWPSLICWRI